MAFGSRESLRAREGQKENVKVQGLRLMHHSSGRSRFEQTLLFLVKPKPSEENIRNLRPELCYVGNSVFGR